MKRRPLSMLLAVMLVFACSLGAADPVFSRTQSQSSDQKTYEEYRGAIKKAYGIDIKSFKEKLKGGRADGKEITKYDLQQLLIGIKVEQEHTPDTMTALEISMDHLEEFPDYYTRLAIMEEDAEREMKDKAKRDKK